MTTQLPADMQQAIDACLEAYKVCGETAYVCQQNSSTDPRMMQTMHRLVDCAEICIVTANFMLRRSENHPLTCEACVEICAQTARDCEALAEQDECFARCAQVCRLCSEACLDSSRTLVAAY